MSTVKALFVGLSVGWLTPAGLTAQGDTQHDTLQAPGPRYRASGLHSLLFGKEYRSLWTTPVTVPVLDIRTFAGGLHPVSKGGGQQTKSLLLAAPNGREFFFRSVDKDPSAALPPELRGTVAASVVRDQTSSAFPTAPLVVDRLLAATGILHPTSHFFVLPSRGLGEFQSDFGGLMGFLEERVGGPKDPAAHWGGATEIVSSDTLFARLDRSTADRVDARAFLTARLFDVLIGDWDRHSGQWTWARFGETMPRRWVPIPTDRDQAMVKYDGVLMSAARQTSPQLVNFGPKYAYMPGATWNGRNLDRRFLSELDWPVWESVVGSLRAALTDSVIDDAVRALPPQHYALKGQTLANALRSRRDHLLEAADRYYRQLGKQVDVYATDAGDQARLTRGPGGEVELTLSSDSAEGGPYFRRQFDPKVTKEVRLYLGGGDDIAVVTGKRSGGPRLRIVAGEGQDGLVDSTGSGGERFYDDPAGPARTLGSGTGVDRRPYVLPPRKSPKDLPPRDWGSRWTASTQIGYGPEIGFFIGGGRTFTKYGFRKNPYSSRHRFRAGIAFGPKTYRVDYYGELRRENSSRYADLLLRASGVDVISFRGFGNEIAAPADDEFYRVTQDAYGVHPSVVFGLGPRTSFQVGPALKYVSTDNRPDRFLATLGDLYGTGNFGEIGFGLTLRHDSRDRPTAASRGIFLEVGGNVYPAIWDVDSSFGEVHGEVSTYLTARVPSKPTLALRAGGKKLWGQYPFFESAFIGGVSTVRLGMVNRYAGDASAYGSAELRLSLVRLTLVLPAEIGVFGLGDVGRVFLDGESSDRWHGAAGGGIWLSYLNRAYTLSLAVASGEEQTGIYAQAGFGF
ncbi:MAG TPA: BamA/TamA family outer membrane protein [Gemmatimonadales bacterium]